MRSILAGLRTLTLPWGAPSTAPHITIGVSPIPPELVAYYAAAPIGTNPETVVGLTINYDGAGNYAYQALVIDSSTPKITSLVTGASVAGTVNEASRFALNPGVVLGNARFQTFFDENVLLLLSTTGSNTVLAAQAPTDAFHRWSLSRDGVVGAGSGAALTDCFQDRIGVGNWRMANRLDLVDFNNVATDAALAVGLSNEANQRLFLRAGGEIRGSDGTNTSDTGFARSAAGVWRSDKIVANISGVGETWHGVSFGTGWANSGGADAPIQYRLMPDGTVHLAGVGVSPSGAGYTQIMTTLPAGYRPVHSYGQVYIANDGNHLATVDSSGNVTLVMTATSTKFWINLRYPIDGG